MPEKVRIFIGSGEASCLERKTLIYSLRKHSKRELDIHVFNGTHNAVERNDEPPYDAGLPLHIKYRNYTEFSNYRFLIPKLCGYQGRAMWLDSDMICLSDIGEIFDAEMHGCDFLAKSEAYAKLGKGCWALSLMLIDCSKCRFDLETYFKEIDQGLYTNGDLHQMTPKFLQHHPFKIAEHERTWNVFDQHDPTTKLIHYTNLSTQPWKFPGHAYGELWHKYFKEARDAGAVSQRDVQLAVGRAYCRRDILAGNSADAVTVAPPPAPAIAAATKVVDQAHTAATKPKGLRKVGREIQRAWDKFRGRTRAA
jgi:hypothetical protein